MGTRGLTAVVLDGTHRIAQYGQWDHYPEGQGVVALEFCRKWLTDPVKASQFVSNVAACRFMNDDDRAAYKQFTASIGVANGWCNMEQSAQIDARYPLWTRDHGANILNLIAEPPPGVPLVLRDEWQFAADSLFCEYAYVVDLDARTLEVFKGFNHKPAVGRFADLKLSNEEEARRNADKTEPYTPVTLVATFSLDNLPSKSVFLEVLREKDEDGEAA